MPNMDDISFFGSSDYSHRGGIWADAARRERQSQTVDVTPDPNAHLPQVQIETASEVLSTTLVSPPPPTQDPNISAFEVEEKRDQNQEHASNSQQKDENFESPSPPRSTTSAVSQPRPASFAATRRRSWFLPMRGEDPHAESEPILLHADDVLGRGRPEEIIHDHSSGSRSASTHSDTGLDPNAALSEPSSLPKTPPPLPRRKEPPQQQSETEETVPAPSRSPRSLFGRVGTSASTNSNGLATSSLFSTLKARAADKEGLKDTAKEAVKKWSANWAGLKKGSTDGPGPGTDDGQVKGSSYAEIRRNVEERHKTTTTAGHPTGTNETPGDQASPSPRTLGGPGKPSIPGTFSTGQSTSSTDSVNDSASQDAPADRDDSSRDREAETDVAPPAPVPHPIYTQPSAPKMMMIPGIHASHRGEVQSMGYVAPIPEPAEPKIKAPAIQNVYRLWKNPGSGQPTSSASKEPMEPSHSEDGDVESSSFQFSQSDPTSSSSPPNLKRTVPPPLPARAGVIRLPETSVTKASPEQAESGNLSASAALKSIATLGNNGRRNSSSSFEHMGDNLQSPPVAATGDS